MDKQEEWNNFMHRVTEVSGIINGLLSDDKEISGNAQSLADRYLSAKTLSDDEQVDIKIKYDKVFINKTTDKKEKTEKSQNEVDPETFMMQVSLDAEKRANDRKVRMEKADTFKTQAAKAFKRGEYDLALQRYDKAIEQTKDSCLLYTNRALTLLKLKQYNKVISDCEWAIKINKNSFKAKLYMTKAYKKMKLEQHTQYYNELLELYPNYKDLIDDFLKETGSDDEDNISDLDE